MCNLVGKAVAGLKYFVLMFSNDITYYIPVTDNLKNILVQINGS